MSTHKLEKLKELRDIGELSNEQFEIEKRKLLNDRGEFNVDDSTFGMNVPDYAMLLHLSQFASFMIPFAGVVIPVILWIRGKENHPVIDEHGRNVLNWIITSYIMFAVCGALMFFLIGFVLILIPIILSVVFPIMGAVKSRDGIVWRYPFSFNFF